MSAAQMQEYEQEINGPEAKQEAADKTVAMAAEALKIGVRDWGDEPLDRREQAVYAWFYDKLVRPVVGCKKYRENIQRYMLGRFVTRSDEALALVLLENNKDYWANQYLNPKKKDEKLTNDEMAKRWGVKPFTLETGGRTSKLGGGWTKQGQTRYVDYLRCVTRRWAGERDSPERIQWKEFQQYYAAVCMAAAEGEGVGKVVESSDKKVLDGVGVKAKLSQADMDFLDGDVVMEQPAPVMGNNHGK